mmetsp:Transcript_13490/g.27378  ORF Transcript_13490/g.27378 Transcript_13490/m.27378 type:complete len:430 (-) Transcript_13490:117-1406(-)
MAKSKSSSSPLSFMGSSAKKSLHSASTIEAGKNNITTTYKKETRQDDNNRNTTKTSSPPPSEQRQQALDQDQSFTEDYLDMNIDIDQLSEELQLQESVVTEKTEQVKKWKQILATQRDNIHKDVTKWQQTLAEATKEHRDKYEEGVRKWQTVLADGIVNRADRYEKEMKAWQSLLDGATSMKEFKAVRQEWHRLEAGRHAPTKEMRTANERLQQLEEAVNVPTKAMKEAQKMIDTLIQKRDAPTNTLVLTSKREKKYVKDVMKWQNALADATAKHKSDCAKWEEALVDSSNSKKMKQVRRMLRRLLATREVPTADMEQAIQMLERLEEEKDAHTIVLTHAASTVHKLEEELLKFQGDMNLTKKLIGNAVASGGLPNSFDDSFSVSDDGEDNCGVYEGCEGEDCINWLCGATGDVGEDTFEGTIGSGSCR